MTPDRLPDRALVDRARAGEPGAFARLVERHYRAVLASARRFLGDADAAPDAAQEAVVRALLGLDRLRDGDQFGPWLVGIGLNVCRSLIVAEARRRRSLEALAGQAQPADAFGPAGEPLTAVFAADIAVRVRAAVAELPPGQRRAAALFYLAGLTHAEIADEIGTTPGAVKTRLHKARSSLRAALITTYEEYAEMPQKSPDLVPMRVAELRRTDGGERHVVFLVADDDRRLPIWIGQAEATALALILEDVETPRPGVYQFAAALLAGAGGTLHEVRITALTSNVFYAQAVLDDGTAIDARPSDALTLALVTDRPILVADAVLRQATASDDRMRHLLQEAEAANDDARTIAEEAAARWAAIADELAELTASEAESPAADVDSPPS